MENTALSKAEIGITDKTGEMPVIPQVEVKRFNPLERLILDQARLIETGWYLIPQRDRRQTNSPPAVERRKQPK